MLHKPKRPARSAVRSMPRTAPPRKRAAGSARRQMQGRKR